MDWSCLIAIGSDGHFFIVKGLFEAFASAKALVGLGHGGGGEVKGGVSHRVAACP